MNSKAYEDGRKAFLKGEESYWEDACPDYEDKDSWKDFKRGFCEADAESELTKEEVDWCRAFAKKIGALDCLFLGDVWRGRTQKVEFIMKEKTWQSSSTPFVKNENDEWVEGTPVYTTHTTISETMHLLKSEEYGGWTAYMESYNHCYLQGNPEDAAPTPEQAIKDIAKKLKKKAKKYNKTAKSLLNSCEE